MRINRFALLVVVIVGTSFVVVDDVHAQRGSAGIRGGLTDDPDSIFFGGQVIFRTRSRLRIEPSAELGIGENTNFFSIRGNLNLKFVFPVSRDVAFFPLVGPTVYYINFDCSGGDCDDTNVGLNLGFGFWLSGFTFEFIVGVPNEVPDLTLAFTYSF